MGASPLDPESSASTNSATPTDISYVCNAEDFISYACLLQDTK